MAKSIKTKAGITFAGSTITKSRNCLKESCHIAVLIKGKLKRNGYPVFPLPEPVWNTLNSDFWQVFADFIAENDDWCQPVFK